MSGLCSQPYIVVTLSHLPRKNENTRKDRIDENEKWAASWQNQQNANLTLNKELMLFFCPKWPSHMETCIQLNNHNH